MGNVFLSLPSFTSLNVYAYFYPGGSPCLKIPNYLRTCAFTAHTHCCSPRGKPNCPSASFQTQLCPPSYHFLSGYPMMSPLSSPSPLVLSPTALVSFQLLRALLVPIHSSSVLHPPLEHDMYTVSPLNRDNNIRK